MLLNYSLYEGWQSCSTKGQAVNILGFVGGTVSRATAQQTHCSAKSGTENILCENSVAAFQGNFIYGHCVSRLYY